eukprot:Platyproteum_vivax@DN10570_c0_g1_i1.p1
MAVSFLHSFSSLSWPLSPFICQHLFAKFGGETALVSPASRLLPHQLALLLFGLMTEVGFVEQYWRHYHSWWKTLYQIVDKQCDGVSQFRDHRPAATHNQLKLALAHYWHQLPQTKMCMYLEQLRLFEAFLGQRENFEVQTKKSPVTETTLEHE